MKTLKLLSISAILVLLFLLAFLMCGKENKQYSTPSKRIEAIKNSPIVHYKDAGGTDHAEKAVAAADLSIIEKSYQHTIDSLSRLLKIKPKQLTDVVSISTSTNGKFKPLIIPADSAGQQPGAVHVSYSDAWLSIKGAVHKDSTWHYSYKDSLTFITYRKKTGFLKRELFLNAFSYNPNSTVSGMMAIKINDRPKKWAISVFAGYGHTGYGFTKIIGIGLTRSIIRF